MQLLNSCNMAIPCLGMSSKASRNDVIEPGMLHVVVYLLKFKKEL